MPIHSDSGTLDPGSYGGFDEAEARRQAIRRRLAQGGQAGGSVLERAGVDVPTTPFQPTVAGAASPSEAARDSRSVLERNEQSTMGPFQNRGEAQPFRPSADQQSYMQRELAATAARNAATQQRAGEAQTYRPTADQQAYIQQELAATAARNAATQQAQRIGETQPPSQQAQRDQRIGETVTPRPEAPGLGGYAPAPPNTPMRWLEEQFPQAVDFTRNVARTIGPIGAAGPNAARGALGGASRGIDDLAGAIRARLGRVPSFAAPAVRAPVAAERAGGGFRLIGGADDGINVVSGAERTAAARQAAWRARSVDAARREAHDAMPKDLLAAARQAAFKARASRQAPPIFEIAKDVAGVPGRLGRLPTPVKIGGVGLGAGLAGVGVLQPQASPNDGANQIGQYEQKNAGPIGNPSGPTAQPPTAPTAQPPEGTPPAVGSVNPIYEPPRGPYTPVPQFGSTPVQPLPTPPTTGFTPFEPPAGLGPNAQPINEPRGFVNPIDEGRRGGPPSAATPGQTPTGPTTGPLPEGPLNSDAMRQQVVADLNGIAQIINAGPMAPDVMAIFASQGSKLLELIAEQEKTLRAQAESEGRTIDPATQNTLDVLREQLGLQLKQTRETLNSRGLLDSGILVEAEQILRKGNLQGQAAILAERLSRIQNNLNQGLGQFRQQRIQSATTFGMAGAQAQTQAELAERKRMDDLRQTLVQGRMGLGNQYANGEQNALDRELAVAKMQAEIAARTGDRLAEQQWRSREEELNRQNALRIAEMNNTTRQAGQYPPNRPQPNGTSVGLATGNVVAELQAAGATYEDAIATMNAYRNTPGYETVNWQEVLAAFPQKPAEPAPFKWPWEQ